MFNRPALTTVLKSKKARVAAAAVALLASTSVAAIAATGTDQAASNFAGGNLKAPSASSSAATLKPPTSAASAKAASSGTDAAAATAHGSVTLSLWNNSSKTLTLQASTESDLCGPFSSMAYAPPKEVAPGYSTFLTCNRAWYEFFVPGATTAELDYQVADDGQSLVHLTGIMNPDGKNETDNFVCGGLTLSHVPDGYKGGYNPEYDYTVSDS